MWHSRMGAISTNHCKVAKVASHTDTLSRLATTRQFVEIVDK